MCQAWQQQRTQATDRAGEAPPRDAACLTLAWRRGSSCWPCVRLSLPSPVEVERTNTAALEGRRLLGVQRPPPALQALAGAWRSCIIRLLSGLAFCGVAFGSCARRRAIRCGKTCMSGGRSCCWAPEALIKHTLPVPGGRDGKCCGRNGACPPSHLFRRPSCALCALPMLAHCDRNVKQGVGFGRDAPKRAATVCRPQVARRPAHTPAPPPPLLAISSLHYRARRQQLRSLLVHPAAWRRQCHTAPAQPLQPQRRRQQAAAAAAAAHRLVFGRPCWRCWRCCWAARSHRRPRLAAPERDTPPIRRAHGLHRHAAVGRHAHAVERQLRQGWESGGMCRQACRAARFEIRRRWDLLHDCICRWWAATQHSCALCMLPDTSPALHPSPASSSLPRSLPSARL